MDMTSDEILLMKLRMWQMEINEELKQMRFKVPVHLGLGTEALVVAIASVIHSGDNLLLSHRNAAFNLVLAEDPGAVVREYRGLNNGLAFGQLGSMNLVNPKSGVVYSSSILGNNISVACGCAYGRRINQS
jgi:pyruvate dehydrogenase E1 component alpha subunit